VVYPRAKLPSPRLRVFIDWLAGRFRAGAATG
jgi:DNA-binding transcriptional LysR family regulator